MAIWTPLYSKIRIRTRHIYGRAVSLVWHVRSPSYQKTQKFHIFIRILPIIINRAKSQKQFGNGAHSQMKARPKGGASIEIQDGVVSAILDFINGKTVGTRLLLSIPSMLRWSDDLTA